MKLAIVGHGRSGKDTAAEYLASISSLRYVAGTSYWARHLVFSDFAATGVHYLDAHACWLDRHNHRQRWAKVIGDYNRDDPVQLYRDCLRDQSLLTGIRWRNEMQACRAANLVDAWVWIDRPNIPVDPTMEFGADECDFTIHNSGTLEQFHARLRLFAKAMGVLLPEKTPDDESDSMREFLVGVANASA
jgi:hypothetical protein